eukprot:1158324-Pelagomonas_calceolata.AAC.1
MAQASKKGQPVKQKKPVGRPPGSKNALKLLQPPAHAAAAAAAAAGTDRDLNWAFELGNQC